MERKVTCPGIGNVDEGQNLRVNGLRREKSSRCALVFQLISSLVEIDRRH